MANRLHTIVNAIRTADYATATEGIAQVLQRKVEERLSVERTRIGASLVREAPETVLASKKVAVSAEAVSNDVKVVKSKNGRGWDIEVRGEVIEGGFFEKDAAEEAAEYYRDNKDFQVAEAYDPSSAKKHTCPKCKHVWWGVALKKCPNPSCGQKISEDSSGGRATPGKCAKCGKPAQWYHNRLDKKFCASCAPNDTMSRIQPTKNIKEWDDDWSRQSYGYEDGTGSRGPNDPVKSHRCPHCGKVWYGPRSETECPKCYKGEYDEKD